MQGQIQTIDFKFTTTSPISSVLARPTNLFCWGLAQSCFYSAILVIHLASVDGLDLPRIVTIGVATGGAWGSDPLFGSGPVMGFVQNRWAFRERVWQYWTEGNVPDDDLFFSWRHWAEKCKVPPTHSGILATPQTVTVSWKEIWIGISLPMHLFINEDSVGVVHDLSNIYWHLPFEVFPKQFGH